MIFFSANATHAASEASETAIPTTLRRSADQPKVLDWDMAHGVSVKVIPLPDKGKYVPQHSHAYPHVTCLVRGSIRVWKDDIHDRDYAAPCGVLIDAHVKHTFLTLTSDVVLLCVHDVKLAGIEEEHQFEGIV